MSEFINKIHEMTAHYNFISTGYVNMREVNAALFGEDVIDKTVEVYGLDEDGELRGSYRPSGYPGVSAGATHRPTITDFRVIVVVC